MSQPAPTFAVPPSRRRWYQFSLRTIFVVITLIGIGLSTLVVKVIMPAERQRAAVRHLESLQGIVTYANPPEEPSWLRRQLQAYLPRDYFDSVKYVNSGFNYRFKDNDVIAFEALPQLEYLSLYRTLVTDAGLVHLKGLNQLRELDLANTPITDAGLAQIKSLTQLQILLLYDTQVTDAGIAHLEGLAMLEYLHLENTQITDAGLSHLRGLTQLKRLDLSRTRVTDAGLAYLTGLTQLQALELNATKVTDAGIAKLKKALPNCRAYR